MKSSLLKAKTKTRKSAKPRAKSARSRNRKHERGALASRALPGALLVAGALLAVLTAFHFAHHRLAPAHGNASASLHDSALGR